jgi:hypothetical protein
MPKLTSAQAFALAQGFHDVSVEIGNFRFRQGDTLSSTQRKRLEDLQFDVLNASTMFNALSLSLELDELQETLDRVGMATVRMKNAIKKINSVQRVIKIATAAVTLGAAVVSMNPGAIIDAVSGVADVLAPA